MSIAIAQCKHIFGLKGDVAGNVAFIDETNIVYPSGASIVLYNIDQKIQRFITCSEKSEGITAMALSPNGKFCAVAEKGSKATITIFDLHSLRKKKLLSHTELQSAEFVSVAFSPDSKYLLAQAGKPDWQLIYWNWEKSKIMAKITASQNPANAIHQVSFNPHDNTLVVAVGDQIIKQLRYTEGVFKQSGFVKIEPANYTAHAWAAEDRLIVGTDQGRLLVFDNGELKVDYSVHTDMIVHADYTARSDTDAGSHLDGQQPLDVGRGHVKGVVAYSKGFAAAIEGGCTILYEKIEDTGFYKRTKEIRIPFDSASENQGSGSQAVSHEIRNLVLSPAEDILVASTVTNQLYQISMSGADFTRAGEVAKFDTLAQTFHYGQITGSDVCVRKPYIVTCSMDKTVRIWNYETNGLELWKEFAEEAHSVAMHPSGLYILVGFSDKLRLMNILIDDIRTFKEITIRGCKECAFSNGGSMFAAVQNSVIQIYSSVTFDNLYNLKGHNGKVRQVIWSADDSKLISCGQEGAVYEWEILTQKRVNEIIMKTCAFSSVTASPESKSMYAVGNDKTIKEIADSAIIREVDMVQSEQTQIVISHGGRMLFTGNSNGMLRCIKFPLTVPGEWQEYQAHSGPISRMKISYDDQYLFTCSNDGSLMVWKITDKEGRSMKRDKEVPFSEEILVTKTDLEEKNQLMTELHTRVDELKMENEYQMRIKEMSYNDKIKELTDRFMQEVEAQKTKAQVYKTEKDQIIAKNEENQVEMMEKHGKEMQDIENTNNQKLMLEYEKYQELQAKSQKMQEDYERQLQENEEVHNTALQEQTEHYAKRLEEKEAHLAQAQMEAKEQQRESEETKKQIEEDGDREILDIKNKYEKRLRDEQETNLKLKNDSGIMRKKHASQAKIIEDLNSDKNKLNSDIQKLNGLIKSLDKDISGLKKEIQERDETIQDKEKRIYDLKKKNQELEKFKFVLDYKINELKKVIEPRETQIKEKNEQIQQMESELERISKSNEQLDLEKKQLKQKLKATENEMRDERIRVREKDERIKQFQADLHNTVGLIQEPKKLKDSIKGLYVKYADQTQSHAGSGGDGQGGSSVDNDIQKEYSRQREHLERSVASLRKKLAKDTEIHRADNVRIMQENVTLIKEINDLRRELKICRSKIHDYEAQLGIANKKNAGASGSNLPDVVGRDGGMKRSSSAMLSGATLTDEQGQRIIEMQREEIGKLRSQMNELEEQLAQRPTSASRLPPMGGSAN